MADIEFTHSVPSSLLQIAGRVGQTVSVTLTSYGTGAYLLLLPLPLGLILTGNIISGTLLRVESLTHTFGISYGGGNYISTQYDVIAAAATAVVTAGDLASILAGLSGGGGGGGGGSTADGPNLPETDPVGGLTGTNAEGDISVPVDFDLTTDQVFIPDGFSLPTAGEASTVALPDWAPGTFAIGSIMSVKEGDRFPIAIGFLRPGELIEVGGLTEIEVFARERAGEKRIDLSEAGYVEMDNVLRYKVILNLQQPAIRQILQSYESPNGAYVDLMCEIRITVTIPSGSSLPDSVLVRTSHTFAMRFEQKMGS